LKYFFQVKFSKPSTANESRIINKAICPPDVSEMQTEHKLTVSEFNTSKVIS